MKRTPLPPRAKPMRRSWFRHKRSQKRRAVDRAMATARQQLVERDRYCILCNQPGDDPHHRLPQGSGGALNDPTAASLSRLVLLCRKHHDWVESHRRFAGFLGLIVRHGIVPPAEVPLFHHGRWVLIDDGGCVLPCDPPLLDSADYRTFAECVRVSGGIDG